MELKPVQGGSYIQGLAGRNDAIAAQSLPCTICTAKGFNSVSKLNKHKQSHTKPYECLAKGCHEAFAQKQALTRHREVKHTDKNSVTKFYHCTVDGCKYSSKGRRSKRFARIDQVKGHIKDYGHYGPHSSSDRPRRAGKAEKHIYLEVKIIVFYEEWSLDQWEVRSCEFNSMNTRLWFTDDIGELYTREPNGSGLACTVAHCYYSNCPPAALPFTGFKSLEALHEHTRRAHEAKEPEQSLRKPASQEDRVSEEEPSATFGAMLSESKTQILSTSFHNQFPDYAPVSSSTGSTSTVPELYTREGDTSSIFGLHDMSEQWRDLNFDFDIDGNFSSSTQIRSTAQVSASETHFGYTSEQVAYPRSSSATSTGRLTSISRISCQFSGCNTTCKRTRDMQRHLATKHYLSQSFGCKFCSRKYNRRDKLAEHLRHAHQDVNHANLSAESAASSYIDEQSIFMPSSNLAGAGSLFLNEDLSSSGTL